MSTQSILNENWSEYDNKKKRWEDRFFFSCEEDWEVEYLVNKITRQHPSVGRTVAQQAIAACCTEVRAPRPRAKFVECVMRRLGLHY